MGDTADLVVTIYSCPPKFAGQVLDVLVNYDVAKEDKDLILGEQYDTWEASVGTGEEIQSALSDIEGVAFDVTEGMSGGYLGTSVLFTPELGSYSSSFGDEEYVAVREVLDRLEAGTLTAHWLGKPWRDAIQALSKENDGTVLPRPSKCKWCGEDVIDEPEADYGVIGVDGSLCCEIRLDHCPACQDGEAHPHQKESA